MLGKIGAETFGRRIPGLRVQVVGVVIGWERMGEVNLEHIGGILWMVSHFLEKR